MIPILGGADEGRAAVPNLVETLQKAAEAVQGTLRTLAEDLDIEKRGGTRLGGSAADTIIGELMGLAVSASTLTKTKAPLLLKPYKTHPFLTTRMAAVKLIKAWRYVYSHPECGSAEYALEAEQAAASAAQC